MNTPEVDGIPKRIILERISVEAGMCHYCTDGHVIVYSDKLPPDPLVYIYEDAPRFGAEERAALEWAEATLDTMVRYGCAAAITEGIESSNRVHATTLRKMLEEEE